MTSDETPSTALWFAIYPSGPARLALSAGCSQTKKLLFVVPCRRQICVHLRSSAVKKELRHLPLDLTPML